MNTPGPAEIFQALGDPVRRGILELLAHGQLTAGAIVTEVRRHTRVSQPAVSQHLKVLRTARLVDVHAEGTRRVYALDDAGIAVAQAWLTTLADPIQPFAQPLDALATEVARGTRARRSASESAGADMSPSRGRQSSA